MGELADGGSVSGVDRDRTPMVSADLDTRFEAVVLVGDDVTDDPAVVPLIRAFRKAGGAVGVVSDSRFEDVLDRLTAGPEVGELLVACAQDATRAVVDTSGMRQLPPSFTTRDRDALARAADVLVRRLHELDMTATLHPSEDGIGVIVQVTEPRQPEEADDWDQERPVLDGLSPQDLRDLATNAAQEADAPRLRLNTQGGQVVLQLGDEVDAIRWMIDTLWEHGIGPSATLLVCSRQGLERLHPLPGSRAARAIVAVADPPEVAFPPSTGTRVTHADSAVGLLRDQVRRRQHGELPRAAAEPDWQLVVERFDPQLERVREALLSLGDGRIGVSGAPLVADPSTRPWGLAIGVYDGEGADSRLLTGPVAFCLPFDLDAEASLRRVLDLRTGVLHEEAEATSAGPVSSTRFVSLARPATLVVRAQCSSTLDVPARLEPPSDDPVHDEGQERGLAWMRVAGTPGGIAAAAHSSARGLGLPDEQIIDRVAAYEGNPDSLPDTVGVLHRATAAADAGFDRLLTEQRRAWAARWESADITVEGDDELQLAIRFALFHLMASVPDSGEAAVGARGLTGPGYRGHVFWDSDAFVLPCMAATHPASARAMLEYRIRRLPEAIAAARQRGRSGARFPWESAYDGYDVTPLSAKDRTGRTVPIRTGQLEEHIVADVAWAASHYADWTGDEEFIRGPGLRLLVETARYWASRIRLDTEGTAHLYGVIGPDEYHEPVDDNAYTNVMARWNLRRAADVVGAAGSSAASAAEVQQWRDLASALADGYDANTAIYEQFAGFGRLDPLIIAEVAPRRPIAADLLLGADRVRRSQVLKQADVLMLHHLVPEEVAPDSLVPNLQFYEPRTAHGSSLSPAIHASLFARARDFRRALDALRIASGIDLDDLTGTTASGLHLATMGGLWQALVFGFAGIRPIAGRLQVDPHLPPAWGALDVRVRFHGTRVRVHSEQDSLSIVAEAPVDVTVGGAPFIADQNGLRLRRISTEWRVE